MAFEYRDTSISVAEDCPVDAAETPPALYQGRPTIAAQEFEMLHGRDFDLTMSQDLVIGLDHPEGWRRTLGR